MDRISLAIIAALVGLAALTWFVSGRAADIAIAESNVAATPVAVSNEPVSITIQQGESPGVIARKLERAGVIRSAEHFGVVAGLMGVGGELKAGEYELARGQPAAVVIDRLR